MPDTTSTEPPISQAAAKPPTIPMIDLADQKHRQVVVDREPGVYLGHPTTVLLEDGRTIVIVYPKGHGHGEIFLKRSTDGGLTWSERQPTPGNWITSQETPTIYRVVDAAGVRRLIVFSSRYPVRMAVSEDDGHTWTPLKPIGDFGGTVAMADMVRLKDGSYMAFFHGATERLTPLDLKCRCGSPATRVCGINCWESEDCYYCDRCTPEPNFGADAMMPVDYTPRIAPDGREFGVCKSVSTDGGLTWSKPDVFLYKPDAGLCEPGAIRSPDGSEIALLLRENKRRFNSFITFSSDEGKTWTEPREVPSALTGHRHQGRYTPDGRLFISFRERLLCPSETDGDWVAWVGTWDDLKHGREGQYRVRLMDNLDNSRGWNWDCGYPGVVVLPDGTIVTTTYGHWAKGLMPYIVSVRLKLEELDRMVSA